MRPFFGFLSLIIGSLLTSCATEKEKTIVQWPGSEVFMSPQEAGFELETLELKDGKFRYWFSSDVIGPRHLRPKYPITGTSRWKDQELYLTSGKRYTIRELKGIRTLWGPLAIEHWREFNVIDFYDILVPVESLESTKPRLQPLFTKEEWDRAMENIGKVESVSIFEPHKWRWKEGAGAR